MALRLGGARAELQWGYHRAATLAAWALVDRSLTADVVGTDTFRITQRPLVLVVDRPGRRRPAWRWPVLSLAIADGVLTATLGPQETSDVLTYPPP